MNVQAITATLVLCTLFIGSLPAQSSQDDWWWPEKELEGDLPSEDFRDGFNLRVRLLVGPAPQDGVAIGTPVQVHLDLAKAALDAGWIRDGDRPASFTLDPESVRLVRYTGAWQSIQSHDPVPVTMHQGWLDPDQRDRYDRIQVNPFDERTDPVVTIEWRLDTDLPAFQSAHYYLHFDVVENCKDLECSRVPVDPTAQAQEPLDALYWAGKGGQLFGHHPGGSGVPKLMVIGTEDDTTVWVYTYASGDFPILDADGFNPSAAVKPAKNGFSLDDGQVQPWSFTNTRSDGSVHFMVEADKPVIAVTQDGRGTGEFVPSRDGSFTGTRFIIPPGTGAVHIIAPTLPNDGPNTEIGFTTTNLVHAQNCPDNTVRPKETAFWCVFTRQDTETPATVTVVQGDHPILVQHDHEQNRETTWSQAPSINGGPVGQDFLAITRPAAEGGFVLSALQDSQVHVNDCSVFPCRTGPPFTNPPLRIYDVAGAAAGTPVTGQGMVPQSQWPGMPVPPQQQPPQAPTPPITITTDEETPGLGHVRVLHGARDPDPTASQTTPFGGEAGRAFSVQAPFVVHAFYEGTHVELDLGGDQESFDLSQTQAHAVCSDPDTRRCQLQQDDGTWGTLTADKPVSVFPLGDPGPDYRRYLAAAPSFKEPTVEPGSYRGYLIDVRPQHGQSPVFLEALDDETVRIPFVVENKGRWNNGLLPDTVTFQASTSDSSVARISGFQSQSIQLDQSGPVTTYVDVTIPQGAPADSKATLKVEGRSQGNENMVRGFSVVVFLRQNFDVDLFWSQSGLKVESGAFPPADGPDEFHDFDFTVHNTGSGVDSFDLGMTGLQGGWDAEFLLDGQSVTEVSDVPAGEQVELDLRLHIPQTREPSSIIDITATSKQQATATDMIRLTARTSLGKEVEMDAPDPILEALPGETVTFPAVVRNTGGDAVTLRFDLVEALPPGWIATLDPEFADGSRVITPGNQETVPVSVKVPKDAPAHVLGTVLLRAEGADDPEVGGGVALTVQVKKLQDLIVDGPATVAGDPGQLVQIPLTADNDGNAPEDIRWSVVLPGGWNATLPDRGTILPGNSGDAVIQVRPPSDALAGDVPLQITAQADGFTVSRDLIFHVNELHNLTWKTTPPVVARPGQEIRLSALLVNAGNTDETVTVTASSPSGGSTTVVPQTLDIPAGASRVTEMEWEVPSDASGASVLTLTAQAPGATTTQEIDVRIVPPSLVLTDVIPPDSMPGPGDVAFVTALFHNPSDSAATGVEVKLVSADKTLDGVRFESIGPNGTVVAPLRWVGEEGQALPELTWGMEDAAGFAPIGSQELAMDSEQPVEDVGIPAPSIPLLLAALVIAVVATKNRRHDP